MAVENNDFCFEERDDERTQTGELVSDCEKAVEVVTPDYEEAIEVLPVLEYLGEFKALIDACGFVSYYFNMKKFVPAGVSKAKIVASAYQHDLRYYNDQYREWKAKAERSFGLLSFHAARFGYEMPPKREFLLKLTMFKDRREAYKGYIGTCLHNNRTLSPAEMEKKYANRVFKRLKKKK